MTATTGQPSLRDLAEGLANDLAQSGMVRPRPMTNVFPAWIYLTLSRMLLVTPFTAPVYISGAVTTTPQQQDARIVVFTDALLVVADVEDIQFNGDTARATTVRALPRTSLASIEVGHTWFNPFDGDDPDEIRPHFALTYRDSTTFDLPLASEPSNGEWARLRALRLTLLDDLAAQG